MVRTQIKDPAKSQLKELNSKVSGNYTPSGDKNYTLKHDGIPILVDASQRDIDIGIFIALHVINNNEVTK